MNVLFVSQKGYQCGVGDYGERIFEILKRSKKINFIYIPYATYGDSDGQLAMSEFRRLETF